MAVEFHHSELKAGDRLYADESEISQVTPRVFITNHANGMNIRTLRERRMTHVLHIGDKNKTAGQLQAYRDAGIVHRTVILEDKLRERLSDHFQPIWDFVNTAGTVLIHCSTGYCRAPAAILYVLVRRAYGGAARPERPVADKLYEQIQKIRPGTIINTDFLDQIRAYEATQHGATYTPAPLKGLDFLRADGGTESVRTIVREAKEVTVVE